MSYNQPGPYGGQQPQQPGPYGQQPGPYGGPPQQPGPPQDQPGYGYPQQGGQQPGYGYPQQAPQGVPPQGQPGPYGHPQQQPGPYGQQQAPYGQVPQPPQGGGNKKTGIILGAVAVVVALGVGGYFLLGGGGLEDDGPHKLSAPATVLGDYKRIGKEQPPKDVKEDPDNQLTASGISNAKSVGAMFSTVDITDPDLDPAQAATSKQLLFSGLFGEISDPEKALDQAFNGMKKDPDGEIKMVGEAEAVEPEGLEGAVMKCQEVESKDPKSGATVKQAMCMWADYSTLGMASPSDATGKGLTVDATAKIAADLRNEVRVPE